MTKADTDALMEALSAYLDLPVEEAYRPGVKFHLETARGIAEDILALDLGDHAEPAAVYIP
jgi:Protein of unknown function (DUF4089)